MSRVDNFYQQLDEEKIKRFGTKIDEAIDILNELKNDGLISEYNKRKAKAYLRSAKRKAVEGQDNYKAYISKEIYEENLIVDSANTDYSSQYDF